jgi:hypothetical protein
LKKASTSAGVTVISARSFFSRYFWMRNCLARIELLLRQLVEDEDLADHVLEQLAFQHPLLVRGHGLEVRLLALELDVHVVPGVEIGHRDDLAVDLGGPVLLAGASGEERDQGERGQDRDQYLFHQGSPCFGK